MFVQCQYIISLQDIQYPGTPATRTIKDFCQCKAAQLDRPGALGFMIHVSVFRFSQLARAGKDPYKSQILKQTLPANAQKDNAKATK